MPRFIKRQLKKAGASPGTLVHVGEQKADAEFQTFLLC
jgi:hypothetical protein